MHEAECQNDRATQKDRRKQTKKRRSNSTNDSISIISTSRTQGAQRHGVSEPEIEKTCHVDWNFYEDPLKKLQLLVTLDCTLTQSSRYMTMNQMKENLIRFEFQKQRKCRRVKKAELNQSRRWSRDLAGMHRYVNEC